MFDRPRRIARFSARRWLVVMGLSLGLVVALVSTVETASWQIRASELRWRWAAGSLSFVVLAVALRGFRLQILAQHGSCFASSSRWSHVAAVHQLLFTTLPSGFGDVSFPMLVAKTCQLSMGTGLRVLTLYRLHDLLLLAALLLWGLTGLPMTRGCQFVCIAAGCMLAATPALISPVRLGTLFDVACRWLAPVTRWQLGGKLAARCQFMLEAAIQSPQTSPRVVTHRRDLAQVALAMATWACALGNYACLFRMVGMTPPFVHLLLIVGGLNLSGALAAFAIGGIGVGESALAGILMLLGFSMADAIPISLIVRPAALISILTGSALVACLGMRPNRQAEEAKAWEDGGAVHAIE